MKRYRLHIISLVIIIIALFTSCLPGVTRISGSSLFGSISNDLMPTADSVYNIGSPALRWLNLYIGGNIEVAGTVDGVDISTLPGVIHNHITYVPITGNIQTYINLADAGDTLILASGEYVITSTITVNKQLNIIGQGNAGFYTIVAAPAHGTVISSVTAGIIGFHITSSNVRIASLSINLLGAGSTGIDTTNNLIGIALNNIDVIVSCTGLAQGFMVWGSNAVLRDLTFYITSTNDSCSGLYVFNTNATTQNATVDCFVVTGTTKGTSVGGDNYSFVCENNNDGNTITLNLANSVCQAVAGTGTDVAVASISATTNNAIVNTYLCELNGHDYDAYQMGTNQLNLGGSVLVNNLVFGTVTYRATMASGTGVFGGTLTLGTGSITDSTGTINFGATNLTMNAGTTVDGVDVSDHDARHAWLGTDELNVKDSIFGLPPCYFFDWKNTNGFTSTVNGTASLVGNAPFSESLRTGATVNSVSGLVTTGSLWYAHTTEGFRHRFQTRLVGSSSYRQNLEIWVGNFAANNVYPAATSNHIAFKIYENAGTNNHSIYATNADGAAETSTLLVNNYDCASAIDLYIKYMSGSIKYYYKLEAGAWTLGATHTTNLPTALYMYSGAWIQNLAAADKRISLYSIKMLMGGE